MTDLRTAPAPRRAAAGRAALPSVELAKAAVLAATRLTAPQDVRLDAAGGRVLAEDVVAERDIPARACAAMDGYAVADPDSLRHDVVGEARAGHPVTGGLRDGEAVLISTGAALPAGARAVVRWEHAIADDQRLILDEAPGHGRNVRGPGEDLRAGTVVLRAGRLLDAAALAVAAGAGRGSVRCSRRPRVALVCTGDELMEAGVPLRPGQIHNTNAIALRELITACGADVVSIRRVADDLTATTRAVATALAEADVLITCGGVSGGVHDHVRAAFRAAGVTTHFAGVALRPGKPACFGTRDRQLAFGLPGNPVSSLVAFALFVAPALRAAQGLAPLPAVPAVLGTAVQRDPDREQAVRVSLRVHDGTIRAIPAGVQRSHVSSALLEADGLAIIGAGAGAAAAGDLVPVVRIPGRAAV